MMTKIPITITIDDYIYRWIEREGEQIRSGKSEFINGLLNRYYSMIARSKFKDVTDVVVYQEELKDKIDKIQKMINDLELAKQDFSKKK